jgi:hypothetical protein
MENYYKYRIIQIAAHQTPHPSSSHDNHDNLDMITQG